MKTSKLQIVINKPTEIVFDFVTKPPNSILWIYSIVDEWTNNWPIKKGTIYTLKDKNNKLSRMTIEELDIKNKVGWVSEDKNYHCLYEINKIDEKSSLFKYSEWVDTGKIEDPFNQRILVRLKKVVESL